MEPVDKINQTVSSPSISVDLTYLKEITGGDRDFMTSIVTTFVNDAPNTLERLQTSCAQSNWHEVGQAAHQLKPSLQFVGLKPTLERIKTIEQNCKESSDLSSVPALVSVVVQDIQYGIAELEELFPA
ncbi:Hpt domain-containing protein [Tunicatimonas pelagia]|uniref:Hpt domain-containing protein n=1 Tax=Tunicatimonas pelagia TaxID=931531 RepID=UPI002665E183|nr:Hpt domain-containing protein [Tunicatimonas pelagia]WKN42810.1 Hpt domain-containing protein [Tunicatimonas pelagia]